MFVSNRSGGDNLVGRDLAGYRVTARIGAGAMGVVYQAEHPQYAAPMAIKVLHDNMGNVTALKRRFEREARALSKLDHERIVNITDFGVTDDITFIAMELLQGETLEEVLADAPIDPMRGIRIVREALEGLAYAHDRQLVHRDLKPANIFLQSRGADGEDVKILDFGLVKFLSIDELSQEETLTRKGRIVGTPAYMAPEQITGVSLDARADIYAMGVVLFELLADRRPFAYDRRSQLLRAHLCEPVPPMDRVRPGLHVHPDLEALVLRALTKDPNNRFQHSREMLAAIDALPADAASFDPERRPKQRARTEAESGVIPAEELRAATDSIASSAIFDSSPPPPVIDDEASAESRPFGALPNDEAAMNPLFSPSRLDTTEKLPALKDAGGVPLSPNGPPRAVTAAAWAIAVGLLVAAVAVYFSLQR